MELRLAIRPDLLAYPPIPCAFRLVSPSNAILVLLDVLLLHKYSCMYARVSVPELPMFVCKTYWQNTPAAVITLTCNRGSMTTSIFTAVLVYFLQPVYSVPSVPNYEGT